MLITKNNPAARVHATVSIEALLSKFIKTYATELIGIDAEGSGHITYKLLLIHIVDIYKNLKTNQFINLDLGLEPHLKTSHSTLYENIINHNKLIEKEAASELTQSNARLRSLCEKSMNAIIERYVAKHLGFAYLRYLLENNDEIILLGRDNLQSAPRNMSWSRMHGVHVYNSKLNLNYYIDLGGMGGTRAEFVTHNINSTTADNLTVCRTYLKLFQNIPLETLDFGDAALQYPDKKQSNNMQVDELFATNFKAENIIHENVNKSVFKKAHVKEYEITTQGVWVKNLLFTHYQLQQFNIFIKLIKTPGVEAILFKQNNMASWRDFFKNLSSDTAIENDPAKFTQFLAFIQAINASTDTIIALEILAKEKTTVSHGTTSCTLDNATYEAQLKNTYADKNNEQSSIEEIDLYGLGQYGFIPLLPSLSDSATHIVCSLGENVQEDQQYIFRAFSRGCTLLKLNFPPDQNEFSKIDSLLNQDDLLQDAIIYYNGDFFECNRKNKQIKALLMTDETLIVNLTAIFNNLWDNTYIEADSIQIKLITKMLGREPSEQEVDPVAFKQFTVHLIKSLRGHSFNEFKQNLSQVPEITAAIENKYIQTINNLEMSFDKFIQCYIPIAETELHNDQQDNIFTSPQLLSLLENGIISQNMVDNIQTLSDNELSNLYFIKASDCIKYQLTIPEILRLTHYQRSLLSKPQLLDFFLTSGLKINEILQFNDNELRNLLIFSKLIVCNKIDINMAKNYVLPLNTVQSRDNVRKLMPTLERFTISGELDLASAMTLIQTTTESHASIIERSVLQNIEQFKAFLTLTPVQCMLLQIPAIYTLIQQKNVELNEILSINSNLKQNVVNQLLTANVVRMIANKKISLTQVLEFNPLLQPYKNLTRAIDPLILELIEAQGKDLHFILYLNQNQMDCLESMSIQRLLLLGKLDLDLLKSEKFASLINIKPNHAITEMILNDELSAADILYLSEIQIQALLTNNLSNMLKIFNTNLKHLYKLSMNKAYICRPGIDKLIDANLITIKQVIELPEYHLNNITEMTADLVIKQQLTLDQVFHLTPKQHSAFHTQALYKNLDQLNITPKDFLALKTTTQNTLTMYETYYLIKYKHINLADINNGLDEKLIKARFLFEQTIYRHPKFIDFISNDDSARTFAFSMDEDERKYYTSAPILALIDNDLLISRNASVHRERLNLLSNNKLELVMEKLGKKITDILDLSVSICKSLISPGLYKHIINAQQPVLQQWIAALESDDANEALIKKIDEFKNMSYQQMYKQQQQQQQPVTINSNSINFFHNVSNNSSESSNVNSIPVWSQGVFF